MPEKGIKYLTTLTPLRGIAALLVVIFHCNLALAAWLPEGYTNFEVFETKAKKVNALSLEV